LKRAKGRRSDADIGVRESPIQDSPFSSRAPAKGAHFFGYNPAMISRQEVEHVARLARLHFDEDELARLQPELGQIIDYVQQLAGLDLSGLEPTSHAVPLKNVLRPDEPVAGLSQADAVGNGPDVERGQFVVPRIG
jgi:aspartyl-tRNA(Asn)/glutamyl-tRNA(Gln) amidotransferase subunit C